MARRLRELVECFGQCSYGDKNKWNRKRVGKLEGPFFTGMNRRMNVSSFAMRLNSPSSTSRQMSVAVKFSGPTGIVITFDYPSGGGLEEQYQYLRGWDCSWISNF